MRLRRPCRRAWWTPRGPRSWSTSAPTRRSYSPELVRSSSLLPRRARPSRASASRAGDPATAGAVTAHGSERTARLALEVLGSDSPRWFSGSGLVSAVAELRRCGHIDSSGLMHRSGSAGFEILQTGRTACSRSISVTVVQGCLTLTQLDVRALQLAKAAVHVASSRYSRPRGVSRRRPGVGAGCGGIRLSACCRRISWSWACFRLAWPTPHGPLAMRRWTARRSSLSNLRCSVWCGRPHTTPGTWILATDSGLLARAAEGDRVRAVRRVVGVDTETAKRPEIAGSPGLRAEASLILPPFCYP